MSKLSFEALAKRAEAVVSKELLTTISGGVENICHANDLPEPKGPNTDGEEDC